MDSCKLLTAVIQLAGSTKSRAAECLGMSRQSFSQKFYNRTVWWREFVPLCDALGMDVIYRMPDGEEFLCSDETGRPCGLAGPLMRRFCRSLKLTEAAIAREMGTTRQNLSCRIQKSTFRMDEFMAFMDAFGVSFSVVPRWKAAPIVCLRPDGEARTDPACGAEGEQVFCAETAEKLADNYYASGGRRYANGRGDELYRTPDGTYFMLSTFGDTKTVRAVSDTAACAFLSRFGK